MNVRPPPVINSPQISHYYYYKKHNKLWTVKGLWPAAVISNYGIVGSLKAHLGVCPKSITRLLSAVVFVMRNGWYLAEVVDRYELCSDCCRHSPVQ